MISTFHKFPLRNEFVRFRTRAKQITTSHLRILFHSRSVNNITLLECDSRLSVIVPIKVSKRATTRNWLKRLTYDTLWPLIEDKNIDVVVLFKPLALLKGKQSQDIILSELQGLKFEN